MTWLVLALSVSARPCVAAASLPSPLTWRGLWAVVSAENPELKAARAEADAALSAAPSAAAPPNPTLMLSTWEVPFAGSQVQGMADFQQTVPFPGKLIASSRAAAERSVAARARALTSERRISKESRATLARYGLALRTLRVAALDAQTMQDLLKTARTRFATGGGDHPDLLRAEEEALNADNDRLDADKESRVARAKLNQLMHRPAESEVPEPAEVAQVPVVWNLDDLRARSAKNRPEVAGAEAQEREARALASAALWSYFPDLTLHAAYMPMLRGVGMDMWQAGVGLELPLFGFARQHAESSAAANRASAASAESDAARDRAAFETTKAYLDLQEALRHVALHRDRMIPLASRAVGSAEAAFAGGRIGFDALLDAARRLRQHHLEHQRWIARVETNLGELEEAVGEELTAKEERK